MALVKRQKNSETLQIFWDKETQNHADYFTKHHPTYHHKAIRNTFVHDKLNMVIQRLTKLETGVLQG